MEILPVPADGGTLVTQWSTEQRGFGMIKNLVKHGNSWALVIDKPILDLLKIDPASPVELTTDGRSVTITPTTDVNRKKVRAARKKVNDRHAKAFKKLAE